MKYLRKSGSALEVQLKASVISAIENVLSLKFKLWTIFEKYIL